MRGLKIGLIVVAGMIALLIAGGYVYLLSQQVNHPAAVGFCLYTEEELETTVRAMRNQGDRYAVGGKNYLGLRLPEGSEMWVGLDGAGEVIRFRPFFRPDQAVTLRFSADDQPGSGLALGWAGEPAADRAGAVPVQFELVLPSQFPLAGGTAEAQVLLAAFVEEIEVFPDAAAFYRGQEEDGLPATGTDENGQPRKMRLGVQHFLPMGMWNNDAGASFAGIIRKVEKRRNTFGRREFYVLTIESAPPLVLTAVAEPGLLPSEPRPGQVVQVLGWMLGMIEPGEPTRPTARAPVIEP